MSTKVKHVSRRVKAAALMLVSALVLAVMPSSALAAGTVTTDKSITVPQLKMITPPGADNITKMLGWGLYIGVAACLGGVIFFVIKAVTAHIAGGRGTEHIGALGWCFFGALTLGTMGSLLNGLL